VAVRRRPSYGFDIAGSTLGLRPEAGVSRSTLAQLFPEIDFGAPAAASTTTEEVEKPEETTTAATPAGTGVTSLAGDDTIPGSELEKYNVSGSLSYAAPFNIQVGPSGPQGRGSRLGYSGATGAATSAASQPAATPLSQSASSFEMPELPQFDYSPFESLLAQGQSILDQIQSASQNMGTVQETQPVSEAAPTGGGEPGTAAPSAAPLRLQIKEAAGAAGKPTSLGKTGVKSLISQGADVSQFEKQARAAGVQLGQKAQSAVDRAQVQQIAAAPASLGSQVQQIAKATDSGKITQSAVKALISSGTSAKRIEKVAEKKGVDIGKQAQRLIDRAKDKKK
jgi:hypothetical protein